MRQTKVRPMVESGLLAAFSVILAVIGAYLPMIGGFFNLLWPVPIVLLGVRHGYKWSMLATVVAGVIISLLIHPLQALRVVIAFGLIGIVLGHAFRKNFSPGKTILWGVGASLISKAALLGIGIVTTGLNPFNLEGEIMAKSVEQTIEMYRQMGTPEEKLAQVTEQMQIAIALFKIMIPSVLMLTAVVDTFLNFFIAKVVLRKLGQDVEDFPPFKNWTVPDYSVYFFALSLVMMYWGDSRDITMIYNSGVNICALSVVALFIQGVSLFYYLGDKYNLSRIVRGIILLLIMSNVFLMLLLVYFGAADAIIDYRRLRKSPKIES